MENNNNNSFSTENNPQNNPQNNSIPENNQQQLQPQQFAQYQQNQTPPPQNQWGPPPMPGGDKKGLAIGSLVCGIVGLIFIWWILWVGLVCSITAISLGAISLKAMPAGTQGRSMAVAGLVIGIVATSIVVIIFCSVAVCATAFLGATGVFG